MPYSTERIANELKIARKERGLSQRKLAALLGVPQSHISKIENGLDLRLSSLMDIARALDLEVALVPRKSVSAVRAIARSASPGKTANPPPVARALDRLHKLISALSAEHRTLTQLAQIQRQARELSRLALPPSSLERIEEIIRKLRVFERNAADAGALNDALAQTNALRNMQMHSAENARTVATVDPAYSLDDDDDG